MAGMRLAGPESNGGGGGGGGDAGPPSDATSEGAGSEGQAPQEAGCALAAITHLSAASLLAPPAGVKAPPARPSVARDAPPASWRSDADFMLRLFKVLPCQRRTRHQWRSCPFVHEGEAVRRRSLADVNYSAVMCAYVRLGQECPAGEACTSAHNSFELWLHPARFRTQLCSDGASCRRAICFFAHGAHELRTPEGGAPPPIFDAAGFEALPPFDGASLFGGGAELHKQHAAALQLTANGSGGLLLPDDGAWAPAGFAGMQQGPPALGPGAAALGGAGRQSGSPVGVGGVGTRPMVLQQVVRPQASGTYVIVPSSHAAPAGGGSGLFAEAQQLPGQAAQWQQVVLAEPSPAPQQLHHQQLHQQLQQQQQQQMQQQQQLHQLQHQQQLQQLQHQQQMQQMQMPHHAPGGAQRMAGLQHNSLWAPASGGGIGGIGFAMSAPLLGSQPPLMMQQQQPQQQQQQQGASAFMLSSSSAAAVAAPFAPPAPALAPAGGQQVAQWRLQAAGSGGAAPGGGGSPLALQQAAIQLLSGNGSGSGQLLAAAGSGGFCQPPAPHPGM